MSRAPHDTDLAAGIEDHPSLKDSACLACDAGLPTKECWSLPTTRMTNYSEYEIAAMRRFDVHMRGSRRRQQWHQWAIALGWYAS